MIDISVTIRVEGLKKEVIEETNVRKGIWHNIKRGFLELVNFLTGKHQDIDFHLLSRQVANNIRKLWIPNVKKMFLYKGKIGFFPKWAELSPKWFKKKQRMGARLEILRYKLDAIYEGLMTPRVVTQYTNDNNYSIVLQFKDLPYYAEFHQRGARAGLWILPKRTITRWDYDTYEQIKEMIEDTYKQSLKVYFER